MGSKLLLTSSSILRIFLLPSRPTRDFLWLWVSCTLLNSAAGETGSKKLPKSPATKTLINRIGMGQDIQGLIKFAALMTIEGLEQIHSSPGGVIHETASKQL